MEAIVIKIILKYFNNVILEALIPFDNDIESIKFLEMLEKDKMSYLYHLSGGEGNFSKTKILTRPNSNYAIVEQYTNSYGSNIPAKLCIKPKELFKKLSSLNNINTSVSISHEKVYSLEPIIITKEFLFNDIFEKSKNVLGQ
ncbi:hypothetical protein BPT24_041 [Tenacibaculum phage pT24]|uniref:Uncharacterized protein n=1 Tax=Tenacibaculum phage pT24 TaxID=1880590 RepID=A0A1B4XWG9_9CAUD|nr:hypothetical protein HYP10_gp041 [Tenacibaculum phage pT24]BAV39163.1 hypothetical protein BPT24_041 [Tenacibaculum phage pT24]